MDAAGRRAGGSGHGSLMDARVGSAPSSADNHSIGQRSRPRGGRAAGRLRPLRHDDDRPGRRQRPQPVAFAPSMEESSLNDLGQFMLVDLIGTVPVPLLATGMAACAAALLYVTAKAIGYARQQREFSGWRSLQQDRLSGRVTQRETPFPHTLLRSAPRRRTEPGSGWRAVQRHRIARRRSGSD